MTTQLDNGTAQQEGLLILPNVSPAHIVHCVNLYPELVKALRKSILIHRSFDPTCDCEDCSIVHEIHAVLAKVKP